MTHFFDTSALKWAYIPGIYHQRCRTIIQRLGKAGTVYIAEITILEILNALGSEIRGNRITLRQFASADKQFFADLASGLIQVQPFPASEYMHCRPLLAYVGVDLRRNLESQDAIVAYTARRLAIGLGEKVRLLTSDRTLAAITREVDIFKPFLVSEYLKPP